MGKVEERMLTGAVAGIAALGEGRDPHLDGAFVEVERSLQRVAEGAAGGEGQRRVPLPSGIGYALGGERRDPLDGGGGAVPVQQESLRGLRGSLGLSIDEPLKRRAGGQRRLRTRHKERVVRRGMRREAGAILGQHRAAGEAQQEEQPHNLILTERQEPLAGGPAASMKDAVVECSLPGGRLE